jgi:anti-anti-sigma factor
VIATVDEPAAGTFRGRLLSFLFPGQPRSLGEVDSMQDRDSSLHVDICRDGVVAKVTVTGELDVTTARTLCRRLLDVKAQHPDRLVLDLDGVVFVDVAGARAVAELLPLLEADCPLIVRYPRPSVRRSRLTGLMDD